MNKKSISIILSLFMVLSTFVPSVFAESTGIYVDPVPYYDDVMEDINGPTKLPIDTIDEYRERGEVLPQEENTGFTNEYDKSKISSEELYNKSSDAEIIEKTRIDENAKVTFIVEMEKTSLLKKGFDKEQISIQSTAVSNYQREQFYDIAALENNLTRSLNYDPDFELGFNYTVAITGLSVTTKLKNKKVIEAMPGVKSVFVAPVYSLPTPVSSNTNKLFEPLTHHSTGMIGSDRLNANGYTGKGMRIAILDTGMLVTHPNFKPLPEDKLENPLTREEIERVWDKLNARKTTLLPNAYYNTKIPYRFNYSSLDYNVDHSYAKHDHGTHVAGIAAANKIPDSEVIGVAPDAQLIVMQVFGPGGGADFAQILAALEDCIHLDVDAANLSLGSANGFTDDNAESKTNTILNSFKDTGIQVLIASGNDTNNAYGNNHGNNKSLLENPDIGLAGTPSTYKAALAVASIDNSYVKALYFTVDGREIPYNDTAEKDHIKFIENFKNRTLEYVTVPGFGEEKDYDGIDVTGKVAVVSRGKTNFPDKQMMAAKKGAIACIIRNNEPGDIRLFINQSEDAIPCIYVGQIDGEFMAQKEQGTMIVSGDPAKAFEKPMVVSGFSSWGVTPDLKLKPEIAGVGGQVYSTTDPQISGSNYATWDGTSMATPQVCGASALIKQYFEKNHKDIKGSKLRRTIANIMMSTATPIKNAQGLESSPRSQGAGLVNVVNATTTKGYLTSRDITENRPKGEMGDDPSRSGKFSFNFEINNLSDAEILNYELSGSVNTEGIFKGQFIDNKPYRLDAKVKFYKVDADSSERYKYDFNEDGKVDTYDARVLWRHIKGVETLSNALLENADINKDGSVDKEDVVEMLSYFAELETDIDFMEKVTTGKTLVTNVDVPANSKIELVAEIELTENDKSYLSQFHNGIFIEGFVYAKAQDEVELSMPYVGFYGNWSDAPIFDEPKMEDASLWGIQLFTTESTLIGTNPYFLEGKGGNEYNAISYSKPLAALLFGQLRAAKKLEITVTDKKTREEYFNISGDHMPKSMFNPRYGQIIPTIIENGRDGSKNMWDGLDKNGQELPSGTKVMYNLRGYLDDGDDQLDDEFSIELTIDSVFPEIRNKSEIQDTLRVDENDRTYISLNLWDDQNIAAVVFFAPNGNIMGKYEVDNIPGEEKLVEFDISGFGNEFTILLADYAMNQVETDVVLDLGDKNNAIPKPLQLSKDRLYGCETFDRAAVEAGWFSAKKSDFSDYRNETFDSKNRYYSAEFVNGYIIGMNAINGNIELVTPGGTYWPTQTIVEQRGKIGDNGYKVFYDMALQYNGESTKDNLYAVGWSYKGDNDNNGKDDGYNALFKVIFYENGYNTIDEVGKINVDKGEILTLGITTEGDAYGINSEGKLYSINLEPDSEGMINCTEVGETDFVNEFNYSGINVIQSMGYDHNTDTMYWYAHSQTPVDNRYVNVNKTYKVNLQTAECTEVGTYGPGGPTGLFVPNDKVSDLFKMGVTPTGVFVKPTKLIMVEGQKVKLKTEWQPWNAEPTEVTWSSSNDELATVDDYGFVTAHKEGNVKITATAKIKDHDGTITPKEASSEIEIVPSEDELYSFVIQDQRVKAPYLKWVTFSDKDPQKVTELNQQKITVQDRDGNDIQVPPMWHGGAYYNGYVYSVVKDTFSADGVISQGMGLYKYKVERGATPKETRFGDPIKIGFVEGTEFVNLAFDYNTSRMYVVDGKRGGLGLLDLETADYDYLGDFSGDIGGPAIATAMTITRDGTIIIADMKSKLYIVDPDTMATTEIYNENTDYWYYGSMTYDYNTDSIYWNPTMGPNASPLKLVRLGKSEWDESKVVANVMDIPPMMSRAGTQTTIMFAIPINEPEAKVIPVSGIKITNGRTVKGLEGGTFQLETETTPPRPTLRTRKWTSEDDNIVTVDKYGVMTFKNPGKTRVTVSITNSDEATYGGPFTDTIEVEVYSSSGEMTAFLNSDMGASGYYDYWLSMNDYDLGHAQLRERAISVYTLRAGVYFDNYYYAFDGAKRLLRISSDNKEVYDIIGNVTTEGSGEAPIITGMAMDYKTGICYAVTYDGYFGTMDLNDAVFKPIGKLAENVFALAVDREGTIYGVGSTDYYVNAKLFTIDKNDASLEFKADMPFKAFSGGEYYGNINYNPQMTYDYKNNRLYVNATSHIRGAAEITDYDGMYIINLDDENIEPINIGGIKLQLRGEPKKGMVFLGLMAFKDNQIPEESGNVDGIFMNKKFGRVAVDEEIQLIATIRPSYAENTELRWESSDNETATVVDGVVRGIKPGKVKITASSVADPTKVTSTDITVVEQKAPKMAYSAISSMDGLFRYDIELPAKQPEKIGVLNGNISATVMVDGSIYYVKEENAQHYLYYFDLTTQTSNLVATLSAFSDIKGLAYDKENQLLYAISGFYVFQYQMDKIKEAAGNPVPYSAHILDPGHGTLTSIAVKDGMVYYTANTYTVVPNAQLKRMDKYLQGTPEIISKNIGISMADGKCEMVYDESIGKFYITDLNDNLYYMDENGVLEPIDCVGDNLSITGIALE